MVQRVVEDDTECYRVILVSFEMWHERPYSANFYSSKTGTWSIMDSGLVNGGENELIEGDVQGPSVYDCTTKTLFEIRECASVGRLEEFVHYSVTKDRVFVLHPSTQIGLEIGSLFRQP